MEVVQKVFLAFYVAPLASIRSHGKISYLFLLFLIRVLHFSWLLSNEKCTYYNYVIQWIERNT